MDLRKIYPHLPDEEILQMKKRMEDAKEKKQFISISHEDIDEFTKLVNAAIANGYILASEVTKERNADIFIVFLKIDSLSC